MPSDDEKLGADERVKRSVRRTLANGLVLLLVVTLLALWGSLGAFTLKPGESAVLLRFGRHVGTINEAGFHLTLPAPLVERVIVKVGEVQSEDFGFRGAESEETSREKLLEATMQTSDNNIVRVSFAVQYRIKDAYAERFRLAQSRDVLRAASEAAMREVVGRMTIDGVLSERRGEAKLEAASILQDILAAYESGLEIQDVQLQEVQPPAVVRQAFDDVIGAVQDASRAVNEAEGYRNEVLPNARAEATELREAALGYRDAQIAEATGEAERFTALLTEYRKAPEVTRTRLYLETMETVLGTVEKVVIEPGAAAVLPHLPLGADRGGQAP
jgi:membrane protease subunit HflK